MKRKIDGFEASEEIIRGLHVFHTRITSQLVANHLKQGIGDYTVIQSGKLRDLVDLEPCIECLAECLGKYLEPYRGKPLLIIGIGNADSHFDSLGPKVVHSIPAHLMSLGNIPCVFESIALLAPGVLGQTNISVKKIISGMTQAVNAACIVLIDTSGVSEFEEVGASIRISSSGLTLYHSDETLNRQSFDTPVVVVSVPLVWSVLPDLVKMYHLSEEKTDINLTTTDVAMDLKPSVRVLACGIARTVYPEVNLETLNQIME